LLLSDWLALTYGKRQLARHKFDYQETGNTATALCGAESRDHKFSDRV